MRINELSELLGWSPATIRKYAHDGKIPYHKTPGGHYYFTDDDISKITGEKPIKKQVKLYYARSSAGDKTSMRNQINKLTEAYGEPDKTLMEAGSGLNDKRYHLNKILKLIMNDEITDLYITTPDRLTRFGYHYIELIANEHNVNIHTLNNEKNPDLQTELMQDFMSLIASFAGKYYRLRSIDNQKLLLEEATTNLNNKDK